MLARSSLTVIVQVNLAINGIPGGRAPGSGSWSTIFSLFVRTRVMHLTVSVLYTGGMPNLIWWLDRDTGVAVTILQQVVPFGDKVMLEFVDNFEQALYRHVRGG